MEILERLKSVSSQKYKEFHSKLVPGIGDFLGCTVPDVRKIAKSLTEDESDGFLNTLPHRYYDENMLHGLLLGMQCGTDKKLVRLNEFLPYVDNWAVCDMMTAGLWKKSDDLEAVFEHAKAQTQSDRTYSIRYGVVCFLDYFTYGRFDEIVEITSKIKNDDYYVEMAIGWLLSVLEVRDFKKTADILLQKRYSDSVSLIAIKKGIESLRLDIEQKEFLRSIKKEFKRES